MEIGHYSYRPLDKTMSNIITRSSEVVAVRVARWDRPMIEVGKT